MNADKLEMQVGSVDIRLVTTADFVQLARLWQATYGDTGHELPLSVFYGSDLLDIEMAEMALDREFS